MLDFIFAGLTTVLKLFGVYFAVMALFSLKRRKPIRQASPKTRFAILIAARNEESVIGRTVSALNALDYPRELFDIYVIPNNCTDGTEAAALSSGANIISAHGPVNNKGEALRQGYAAIRGLGYDAVCVFDADNIADSHYLSRMNDAFQSGARVAKGRCLCTNPYDTWVSGCYAIYFDLFNIFYNRARAAIGLSAKLNGTGFAVATELLDSMGGWQAVSIAEDAELAAMCARIGERVWWVPEAVSYDEQPLTFAQSVLQRRRWCGGIMNVAKLKLPGLIASASAGNTFATDMIVFLLTPFAQAISVLPLMVNVISAAAAPQKSSAILTAAALGYGGTILLAAVIVRLSDLRSRPMIKAILTYGIFTLSWVPICLFCLFRKPKVWHEMPHGLSRTADIPGGGAS